MGWTTMKLPHGYDLRVLGLVSTICDILRSRQSGRHPVRGQGHTIERTKILTCYTVMLWNSTFRGEPGLTSRCYCDQAHAAQKPCPKTSFRSRSFFRTTSSNIRWSVSHSRNSGILSCSRSCPTSRIGVYPQASRSLI